MPIALGVDPGGGKIEQRSLDAHDSDQTADSLQKQFSRTFFLHFGGKNLLAVRASKMLWEGGRDTNLSRRVALCDVALPLLSWIKLTTQPLSPRL